ncbi:MAG: NUDIX domain-containing protein [Acetobacteraceae bacterium]|nr:NUDIX domain-containing protein [Acetobacteraceae bacterium]
MPEDHAHAPGHPLAPLIDQHESPRPKTVRARHAASLIVYRMHGTEPEMLMGMRGAKHRFMPNRLVFPGGAVDRVDLTAPCASPLSPRTERALRKQANAHLAHGIGIAAARELAEETGLSLGHPPVLAGLDYLARAVTPAGNPIRFNARFLTMRAELVSGALTGGDGELDNLRYYGLQEALALDLALPTRRVLERLQVWLAMSEAERAAETHTPLLRDRGWRME